MTSTKKILFSLCILSGLALSESSADGLGDLSTNFKKGDYKIGFVSSWPAYGAAIKIGYSEKITLEAIAAPLGDFSTYAAKINYNLTKNRQYNTYAYLSGGVSMYDYSIPVSTGYGYGTKMKSDTEVVPMFGGGVGIEWSWRKFVGNDFPDLYSTIEIGYASMSFDYYDFGGLLYGGGIYYKF